MSLGFTNTLMWSFYSLIPSLRILTLRGVGSLRRPRAASFSFSVFFYKQLAVVLRLGSLLNPSQFVELFAVHLSRAGRFCTFLSFFCSRFAFTVSQVLVSPLRRRAHPRPGSLALCPTTIDNLFDAAWWLEREASEGVGIFFLFKEDGRNLLLEYSNVFKPLLREFPSFGFFELTFNSFLQLLEARRLCLQQS
uniref:NADH dehydrogenase subunit 9 n=1 Tax=Euplotes cristatus TaxID=756077 RepID=UPI002E79F3BF|nr:NADH dehydrogenase subunit 9 [Euplotes cristatus]UPM52063.1 NADH dehydrogenase subunit 9 [Euplotes cristatus]